MTYKLVKAVFLSIDSAKTSGVALSEPRFDSRGTLRGYDCDRFGLVTTQLEREDWMQEALEAADLHALPLIVVGEMWTPHGLSRTTYRKLNESWGLWTAALERERVGTNVAIHTVRVDPQSWRSKVFGKRRPKTREGLKPLAVIYAQKVLEAPPHLADDIAEALCLRAWAERAPEVHALLEPEKSKKSKKSKKRKAA